MATIFTIEIDGRPIAAFNAWDAREARGVCELPEFIADLKGLISDGAPLCGDVAELTVRPATAGEIATFHSACGWSSVADAITFVILVDVDRIPCEDARDTGTGADAPRYWIH